MEGAAKPPQEDVWAFQEIGTPFPDHPVKAQGAHNTYVALWYKHGKPLMGKAFSDSGVVQCVFAWENSLISGRDILGKIQVLQYDGNHTARGFYYEWIKLGDWMQHAAEEGRQPVRCGTSAPVYWPEKMLLGNLDLNTKTAVFPGSEKVVHVNNVQLLQTMQVLIRNTRDSPPHCGCEWCREKVEKNKCTPAPRVMINDWSDYREGDDFPTTKPIILALDRPLKTPTGPEEHYVALWYRHGNPIIGRALNRSGKINASFTDGTRIFTGSTVGSLQLLIQLPPTAAGFDYSWQPFTTAAQYGDKEWHPVHVNYMAPCVVSIENKYEVLGGANMKDEIAQATFDGKVYKFMGKQVHQFSILCRKDRDDTMVI